MLNINSVQSAIYVSWKLNFKFEILFNTLQNKGVLQCLLGPLPIIAEGKFCPLIKGKVHLNADHVLTPWLIITLSGKVLYRVIFYWENQKLWIELLPICKDTSTQVFDYTGLELHKFV